jgi:hypothetical protein
VLTLLQEGPYVVAPHNGYALDESLNSEVRLYEELAA